MLVEATGAVDCPYEAVVRRFQARVEQVLGVAVEHTRDEGDRLTRKVAPAGWPAALAPTVALEVGPLRTQGNRLLVAFSWRSVGASSLFPRLEADLEITPCSTSETGLVLRGSYDPPAGPIGRRVDDLLLHRIAEATLRAFLDSVLASLAT